MQLFVAQLGPRCRGSEENWQGLQPVVGVVRREIENLAKFTSRSIRLQKSWTFGTVEHKRGFLLVSQNYWT